jgi:hypothetical protein
MFTLFTFWRAGSHVQKFQQIQRVGKYLSKCTAAVLRRFANFQIADRQNVDIM